MTDPTSKPETLLAQIVTDRANAQLLADRLADALDPECCAVSIFEQGAEWVTEIVFNDPVLRAQIERQVMEVLPEASVAVTPVAERDWVAKSLEGLAPVTAGHFIVHGAHDRQRVPINKTGIEIEAALAFGTGHHGTTRGCLLAFETLRKRAGLDKHSKILDIGTGTGVLAIAAALALRTKVQASDIDPVAVAVARENARLNHAAPLFHCFTAAGADAGRFRSEGPYDLIFANILEAPLRRMSYPLAALLAPRSHIILSGLLPAHTNGAIAAYRRQGLALDQRLLLDGWATLIMRR